MRSQANNKAVTLKLFSFEIQEAVEIEICKEIQTCTYVKLQIF